MIASIYSCTIIYRYKNLIECLSNFQTFWFDCFKISNLVSIINYTVVYLFIKTGIQF